MMCDLGRIMPLEGSELIFVGTYKRGVIDTSPYAEKKFLCPLICDCLHMKKLQDTVCWAIKHHATNIVFNEHVLCGS